MERLNWPHPVSRRRACSTIASMLSPSSMSSCVDVKSGRRLVRTTGCPALPGRSDAHLIWRLVAIDALAFRRQETHLFLGDALLVAVGLDDLVQEGRHSTA